MGGQWWGSHYTVIKANFISNVVSLVALALCRLIHADGNAIPLIFAVAYIVLRASKLRPLARLHRQVAFVHDHPDDDRSFDDLLSHWAVNRDDKTQKLMVTVIQISLSVVVITLGAAACWDAMTATGLLNSHRFLVNTTHNTTIPLSPTSLNSLPGYISSINTRGEPASNAQFSPTMLTQWCSCKSVLEDAASGVAVGGAAGGGFAIGHLWYLGPEIEAGAVSVGAAAGAAVGGLGGFICHATDC